jgi:hypothetical protein
MKHFFTAVLVLISCQLLQAQTVVITGGTNSTTLLNLTPDAKPALAVDSPKTSEPIEGIYPRHKVFTVSSDLAQYFLCQPNIDLSIRLFHQGAIGVNLGLVEPCLLFAQNPLTSQQYTNPGTVYSGIATRLYFKFYPGKKHKSYWDLQLVYKKLSYNGVGFSDQYGNSVLNIYTMNEHETVYGLEAMHGHELTRENEHLNVDVFYGIGFHERLRNYQVTSENVVVAPGSDLQNLAMAMPGNYSGTLSLFTPVIGLKFGWNYLKRNQTGF